MHLPVLKKENASSKILFGFGGLNLTQSYSPGEMVSCSGISHMEYPAVTQRQKSTRVLECVSPTAAMLGDKVCVAADDGLYYDGKKVADLSVGKKVIASLGKKIVVFPDKVYYDTEKEESGDLSGECKSNGEKVTFTENSVSVPADTYKVTEKRETCTFSADSYIFTYTAGSFSRDNVNLIGFTLKPVSQLSEGAIFHEQCEKNQYRVVINVEYSEEKQEYLVLNRLLSSDDATKDFFSKLNEGDMIEISGCVATTNNISARITAKTGTKLTFSDGTFVPGSETENITFKRKIPDFECVCSYENRLWGCEGNTVYASKLGDVANYFIYDNLSTDSFAVSSNSAGDFTGCISYGNCCLFFKENSCYKLYGTRPSNFQLSECFGIGMKKEDAGSLVHASGKVLYKGISGVYVFYGGIPQRISDKLGDIRMRNAVAGSDGRYYYLTADTDEGTQEFVWDMERDLWCKSGITDTLGYFFGGESFHRLTRNGMDRLENEADENALWSVTLCPFDENAYKTKNYSRIHIRAELFEGAHIKTEVKSDDGKWVTVNISHGDKRKYISIPCRVQKSHRIQIRISGKGRSVLESLVREFSVNH